MIHIEGVQGNQYLPGEPNYDDKSRQYATEYAVPGADPDMSPGLIVYAKGIDDIRKTLQYAKKQTLAGAPTYVATRTGGTYVRIQITSFNHKLESRDMYQDYLVRKYDP